MNIVPARYACAIALPALLASACGMVRPLGAVDFNQRLERTDLPPIDVHFSIQGDHRAAQQRYVAATMAALKQTGEWLGALPLTTLTVVDPPRGGAPPPGAADAIVLERTPLWSTASSMTPELAAARAVSRRAWNSLIDTRALPPWFVEALAEYAARRVVARLFEQDNPPGFAFHEERYFDRFVPRSTRIYLRRESDREPVTAYRANPTATDFASQAGKAVLALGTLERWVGRPVFDQLVAEFAHRGHATPPSLADFARTASEVSAQDLTWLFDEAFGSSRVFDYGVESLTSEPDPAGRFITTVVARRFGDARFTGTSAVPVAGFESGRGITLLVQFADGRRRIDYWDGRDRTRTFHYRSSARALTAQVDPDDTLLLDLARVNNSVTLSPDAASAASGWSARWLAWMELALLTYGSLV